MAEQVTIKVTTDVDRYQAWIDTTEVPFRGDEAELSLELGVYVFSYFAVGDAGKKIQFDISTRATPLKDKIPDGERATAGSGGFRV